MIELLEIITSLRDRVEKLEQTVDLMRYGESARFKGEST
jgi:hypothetical protein